MHFIKQPIFGAFNVTSTTLTLDAPNYNNFLVLLFGGCRYGLHRILSISHGTSDNYEEPLCLTCQEMGTVSAKPTPRPEMGVFPPFARSFFGRDVSFRPNFRTVIVRTKRRTNEGVERRRRSASVTLATVFATPFSPAAKVWRARSYTAM